MTSETQTRKKLIWLLLFIPPLLFTLKDLIATFIVLSYEPGITAAALHNYSVHLLPGSLFVSNASAPALNLAFGVIIGAVLYMGARYRRHRRGQSHAAQQIVDASGGRMADSCQLIALS